MAQRLTWSGIPVKAAVEIQPKPAGLARNIAQCLEDFGIPLYLSTAVTKISGKGRVESVTIAPLDDPSAERVIECDTILYSVGLIPENELSRKAGVILDPKTNGPVVKEGVYETSESGIFACGNVLHVHGLADQASEEAERCADSVLKKIGMR
jgi:thioredoxin reductase